VHIKYGWNRQQMRMGICHLGISQDGKPGSNQAKQHNHSVEEGLRGDQQIAVAMQSSASEWSQFIC
jgi:hypothetical protein